MKPELEETVEEPADEQAREGRRSLARSWRDTIADAQGYINAEVTLLHTETARNFEQLRWSMLKAGAGALFLMASLVLLTTALATWLATLIGMVLTLLLLAAAYLLVGLVLVQRGASGISLAALLPKRSIARLSRNLSRQGIMADSEPEAGKDQTQNPAQKSESETNG